MSKLLKYLTFFITGLLVFVVALALILFVVIDPNRYRPVLEDLVASQTGLQLQIAGDMNWTFRPVFGLSLQDVRLSNGVTPQELASFSNVALRLEPAGLFRGELNLQEFIAEDLHINWTVDSNGQTNWLLDLPPSEAPAQTSSAGSIPVDINIAQVTLNNASIDIQDQQQGLNASLRRLNLSGSNTNLQGQEFPLEISTQLIDQTTNRRLDLNLQSDTSIDLDAGDIALSDIRFNLSPLLITGSAEINNFRNDLSWQADLSSQPFNLSYLLENFMALPEDSMPAPDEQRYNPRRAGPDHREIAPADGEDIAEEIGHEVDPHARQERDPHQPEGQRRMRQHAQQRIHGEAAPRQARDGARHRQRHGQRAGEDRDVEGQRQRHAEDRGMGGGVAEIGHAPPHHEAAQRRGGQRHAQPREGGASEEIGEDHSAASCLWG